MHTDLLFGTNENQNRPFWPHFASKTIDILENKIDVFAAFLTEIKNEKSEKKKQYANPVWKVNI